jgi:outer membrane protein, heavy metal efflux system
VDARRAARQASPDLIAAREAVTSARGRERQTSAYPNPTLAYSREQTSGGGQSTSQNITTVDQAIELGGLRGARREAGRARREAAEARLAVAEAQLDFEVTRAYVLAVATDRRARLADQAANAFSQAVRVSEQRLAAGDISGYATRRLRLEAARYAALRAEAQLARRVARIGLASLIAPNGDSTSAAELTLVDTLTVAPLGIPMATLLPQALRSRAELRAAEHEAQAAIAEATLAGRERIPVPVVSAGFKNERLGTPVDGSGGMSGFAAGVSIPMPIWDRRQGAIESAQAESRRRAAETEAARRRVMREVAEAYEAFQGAQEQVAALAPQLGPESLSALRAAQVAYTEGEISLVEWLDAVRAYREAEASYTSLQADALVRRAALERAVGVPLSSTSSTGGGDAAPQLNQE